MDFKLNFSLLSAVQLQKEGVNFTEIIEVFNGDDSKTVWHSVSNFDKNEINYYLIGFSSKKRFLQVHFNVGKEPGEDTIYFTGVRVSGLEEIKNDFFKIL